MQGQFAPGEVGAGILFALGGDVAVGQHLGGGDLVALDQLAGEGAEGGYLCLGVGLPAPLVGGQQLILWRVAEVDDLDAKRAGIEPRILVPAAAAGMPGALAVGHQLVDRQRPLMGIARDQVVGAHLMGRLGQQAQGTLIVFIRVVQDQKGDALVLAGALMLVVEPIGGWLAGAQQQGEAEGIPVPAVAPLPTAPTHRQQAG